MSAKRIISFIMSIVIAVTAFVPTFAYSRTKSDVAFDRPEIMTLGEYKAKLREEGFPVITTEQFLKVTSFFSSIFRFITGRIFLPQENFDVSFDELVSNACNTVYNDCGLDIVSLLSSIPDFNDPARIAVEVFDIDTDTIRDEMYNKRDEAIKNNDDVMYFVYYFLGAYLAIIEKCTIYGVPPKTRMFIELRLCFILKTEQPIRLILPSTLTLSQVNAPTKTAAALPEQALTSIFMNLWFMQRLTVG